MKKLLIFLLSITILFILCACSNDTNNSNGTSSNSTINNNNTVTTCDHIWNNATCTEPKTCSLCGVTNGIALGHTTSTGICSRCNENFSGWETGAYTDEFGLPTGDTYIGADCYGTFSNSATTNSDLHAFVQIDKKNIGIMLWEYNRNLVKGTFDYEYYDITILDENGNKHYFTGTLYKNSTRIYFKDSDRNSIINILKNNDSVKIYLKSTKYSISTYLFTVNTKGFTSMYNTIN